MRAATVTLLALAAISCGPSLKDTWFWSGEIYPARFMRGSFHLDDDAGGRATMAVGGKTADTRIICSGKVADEHVVFEIEGSENPGSCSALNYTYRFDGTLGRDVLADRILDRDGKQIGIFRAFRKAE